MIEQFTDIRGAWNHLLHHSAEGFEDGGVIDGGKEKLNFLHIHIVVSNFFFELNLILAPGVVLSEVDVCLVDEDEHGAIVGVFTLQIFIDAVEVISCLCQV